jgi:protein-tyrosine phosphatase
MRVLVAEAGLADRVEIDSAGTGAWHQGELPDPRAQRAAAERGVALDSRARQFEQFDFDRFDLVLAMDAANVDALLDVSRHDADRQKIYFLRDFDPDAPAGAPIPDPFYGNRGFSYVFDLLEAACRGLLDYVATEYELVT